MKRIMMLLVAGVLAFGAVERASASTFDLGTLDPGTTSAIVANLGTPAPVSFSDTINFSLAAVQASLVGSLTDLSTSFGAPVNSLNFSLDLFSSSDPLTSLGNFSDATGTALAFSYLNLAAGDYFFRIGGDIGGAGVAGNAYQYRFEVSEVPLPPALLLFATALGGMALFGYRRRNNAQV